MKYPTITTCTVCGAKFASIIYDLRYHGYRGICHMCGCNWPES